eukprot:IDg4339t1
MELGGLKIDKLNNDNFHIWKSRVQLVLSLRELDDYLTSDSPGTDSNDSLKWSKGDRKAKAIIGLTISDSHLEQVQHAVTAKEMWKMICDIYERHTLLNKLSARRKFYTATMKDGERILEFSARIRQLASTLKSMGVAVDNNEMAMALLNGLPERFDSLISALDAIGDGDEVFTFEFGSSRCEQEE